MLRTNKHLMELDLNYNSIGPYSHILFRELAEGNKSIKEIDLSWNSMGGRLHSRTPAAIAYAFEKNERIKHLDLSFNNLT
jgi:hypothetical protein